MFVIVVNPFLNLVCAHLSSPREIVRAFADDLALLATDPGKLNRMLERVREFAEWAGMELCVPTCQVTGYHYGEKRPLTTGELSHVQFNGQTVPPLQSRDPARYLGLHINAMGGTRSEVGYILAKATDLALKADGHPYDH